MFLDYRKGPERQSKHGEGDAERHGPRVSCVLLLTVWMLSGHLSAHPCLTLHCWDVIWVSVPPPLLSYSSLNALWVPVPPLLFYSSLNALRVPVPSPLSHSSLSGCSPGTCPHTPVLLLTVWMHSGYLFPHSCLTPHCLDAVWAPVLHSITT